MALFLVGMDSNIVNVGLPSIGRGLHVGTRDLEWTVDAYTLALASLLISAGAMADRAGRRRVLQLGLTIFGLASLACALAPSIGVLVAARVVQGVGGSMLVPVGLAIVVNVITDARQRALATGIWTAVFGLSMAAGPLAGGALVSALGWRSIFWINAPITAAAIVLSAALVPESRAPQPRRLDGPGQLLLTAMTGLSVAVLIEGAHIGWTSVTALAGYSCVVGVTAGFLRTETRRREPLIDPRLFRRAPFAAAVLTAVLVSIALQMTLLLNTLYLQRSRGMTPLATGEATLPMAVATILCAPISGYLVGRSGPRLPLTLASGCTAAGGLCLLGLDNHTDLFVLRLAYLLIGIGFGFANAPLTNIAVNGLPPSRAGVAGAITSTARNFGTAIGIALAGSIVAGAAPTGIAHASHLGWALVGGCGGLMLVLVGAVPRSLSRAVP